MLEGEREVLAGRERLEAEDIDLVRRADFVVVFGVGEGQGKHALLLQVRLVDTGERAGDDGKTTKEARLERGVLTRRTLTVVVVTNHDPLNAAVAVVGSGLWHTTELASDLVLDLVGLTVLRVDGTDQAVLGDVLQVTTVLQPGTTGRDMVGCTLALDLNEDRKVSGGLAVPRRKGFEELKTLRLGVNGDLDGETVLGRRLEGVLARVVTARGELVTVGGGELEGLAVRANERVGERVEAEVTSEGHRGDDIGGSDEGMGGGVGVVTTGEVTVVGRDDGVGVTLLDVTTVPLANARTTGVSEDNAANALEGTDHAITLDGGANLLRTRGDGELALGREAVRSSFFRNGGRASHILIRRVGARTDETDFQLRWPTVLLHFRLELREGSRKVRGEGTVDVGLKLRQVLRFRDVNAHVMVDPCSLRTMLMLWSYSAPLSAWRLCAKRWA